jgi:hypothetical protein
MIEDQRPPSGHMSRFTPDAPAVRGVVYVYSFVAGPDYAFNYDPNKNTVVGFILLGPTPINRPT